MGSDPSQPNTPAGLDCPEADCLNAASVLPPHEPIDQARFNLLLSKGVAEKKRVYFPSGEYLISENLRFQGLVHLFSSQNKAVFKSSNSVHRTLTLTSEGELIRLENLKFSKIILSIGGRQGFHANVQLNSLEIVNGPECAALSSSCSSTASQNDQLMVFYSSPVSIKNLNLKRDQQHLGRGLSLYITQDVTVSAAVIDGYFQNMMTISGHLYNSTEAQYRNSRVRIQNSRFTRTPGDYHEDHGIYSWGFKDLAIESNFFSGWSKSLCGHAMKLRNGEGLLVKSNTMKDSGILLYTYDSTSLSSRKLYDVLIEDNSVSAEGPAITSSCEMPADSFSIMYWRNFESVDPIEKNIIIRNNSVNAPVLNYNGAAGEVQIENNTLK